MQESKEDAQLRKELISSIERSLQEIERTLKEIEEL